MEVISALPPFDKSRLFDFAKRISGAPLISLIPLASVTSEHFLSLENGVYFTTLSSKSTSSKNSEIALSVEFPPVILPLTTVMSVLYFHESDKSL